MKIEETDIKNLVIITSDTFQDERGYFFESYNKSKLSTGVIDIDFVQDNQSFSKKAPLRGLHYQNPPFAQTKLVRVLQGDIMDVAVDLRKDSPTYGKYFNPDNAQELTDKMEEIKQSSTNAVIGDVMELKTSLENRTKNFAYKYLEILNDIELVNSNSKR